MLLKLGIMLNVCLIVEVISSHRIAKFTVTAYFVMLLLTDC